MKTSNPYKRFAIPMLVAVVALALLSTPALAQRGPHGGGHGGRMARMMEELDLTEQQRAEAQELFDNGLPIPATNTIIAIAGACRKHRMLEDALRFHEKVVEWDNKTRGKSDSLTLALRTNTLGARRGSRVCWHTRSGRSRMRFG